MYLYYNIAKAKNSIFWTLIVENVVKKQEPQIQD